MVKGYTVGAYIKENDIEFLWVYGYNLSNKLIHLNCSKSKINNYADFPYFNITEMSDLINHLNNVAPIDIILSIDGVNNIQDNDLKIKFINNMKICEYHNIQEKKIIMIETNELENLKTRDSKILYINNYLPLIGNFTNNKIIELYDILFPKQETNIFPIL